jgi:hypothetical protein
MANGIVPLTKILGHHQTLVLTKALGHIARLRPTFSESDLDNILLYCGLHFVYCIHINIYIAI